jgi:ribonuclease-3
VTPEERLEEALGHRFSDRGLLRWSLTHRSVVAEDGEGPDNERLEFLGDAVLQLVVTDYLFATFSDHAEGQMAKVRAACVSRPALARVARAIGVGPALQLGRGEARTGGADKDSILADAMEAVLAALYLDAGLEAARTAILRWWEPMLVTRATDPGSRDFKTRLQETLAKDGRRPTYRLSDEGPDHEKTFTAVVEVEGVALGTGTGGSKKAAQQAAAEEALASLPPADA